MFTISWLVVEPTHLKNMLIKLGSSSPFCRVYNENIWSFTTISPFLIWYRIYLSSVRVEPARFFFWSRETSGVPIQKIDSADVFFQKKTQHRVVLFEKTKRSFFSKKKTTNILFSPIFPQFFPKKLFLRQKERNTEAGDPDLSCEVVPKLASRQVTQLTTWERIDGATPIYSGQCIINH